MATTFTLIKTYTLATATASFDFTSIPSTFTDLCLKLSGRFSTSYTSDTMKISFNSSTSTFTIRQLYGNGTSAGSNTGSYGGAGDVDANSATASTFGNLEIYIPNYAGSTYKSYSYDAVTENNATAAQTILGAGLWSTVTAINAISLTPYSGGNFMTYSTASLYGILKA